MKSSKGKTTTYKAISTSLSAEFLGRNCGIEEKGSVHLNWWKGGTYKQDDPTQQGSQSDSTEKQEASQTSKHWGNSAPAKQLCKTLCDPMDCISQPRDPTQASRIAGGFFTSWAAREAQKCYIKQQMLKQRLCTQKTQEDLQKQAQNN